MKTLVEWKRGARRGQTPRFERHTDFVAALAHAQDSLPFPPRESGSTAGLTMQSSVYEPLPAGKMEIESRVAQGRRAGPLDVVVCGCRRSHPLGPVGRRGA